MSPSFSSETCKPDADRTNQLLGFTLGCMKFSVRPTSDAQKAQAFLLRREESKLRLLNLQNCPASEDDLTETVQWDTDHRSNVRVGNM